MGTLCHRATTQWLPGAAPVEIDSTDYGAARKILEDHEGLLWFDWHAKSAKPKVAEANALDARKPRIPRADVDALEYEHTDLRACLDALDIAAHVDKPDRERCETRLAVLRNSKLWCKPNGLWCPGIHARDGVVTASAAALAEPEVLDAVGSSCGVLLGSMSFVVFPRCVFTITWRPRFPLRTAPDEEAVVFVRRALRETKLVYFGTHERYRAAVGRTWQASHEERLAGDLAVLGIATLCQSLIPTTRQLTHRFLTLETRSVSTAFGERFDNQELRSLYDRFLDLTSGLGEYMADVAALRTYGDRMHFVRDTEALAALRNGYDDALVELRELWRDLRVSIDAINSAGTVLLLEAAGRQAELARKIEAAAKSAQEIEERSNKRIAFATALFVPPAFWATIYGADVYLPAGNRESKAWILCALMVLSVLGSLLVLRRLRRKDRKAVTTPPSSPSPMAIEQ